MCKIKYPLEVMSAINKSEGKIKTLSIESYLAAAADKEYRGETQDPLKFYEDFSCFHITLIEKGEKEKRYARANLSVRAIAKIDRRTQIATQMIMESEQDTSQQKTVSTAYTQQIRIGKMRGKTPAQVLLENPDNREQLEGTAKWLKEKGSSHEGNKAQYDAIMEAIDLWESGELSDKICERSLGQIIIHKADYRPLISTKREDGKVMAYTLQIVCNPTDRMPYEIRVGNFWAQYNNMEMVSGSICDKTGILIRLTEEEWDEAVESMRRTMRIYEQCYGKYELERSLESIQQNK